MNKTESILASSLMMIVLGLLALFIGYVLHGSVEQILAKTAPSQSEDQMFVVLSYYASFCIGVYLIIIGTLKLAKMIIKI